MNRRVLRELILASILVTACAGVSAAQPKALAPNPLTKSEAAELDKIRARLEEFGTLAERLQRQPRLARTEFDNLQQQADGLKPLMPTAQRMVVSAISKLRSAGQWNADLDAFVVERLQRAGETEALNEVRTAGGARALLGQASSMFSGAANAIDSQMRDLAPKTALQRLLEPLLGQPVQACPKIVVIGHICLFIKILYHMA
jgi:hypothetical protein